MPSTSFQISSLRPRRSLVGYNRKATDEFIQHTASVLERTSKQLEETEKELAAYREREQSLNDALLAVAKSAEAVKADARREADSIRASARKVDELLAVTCTHLSSFLRETLESVERVAAEIQSRAETAEGVVEGVEAPAAEPEPEPEPEPVGAAEPAYDAEPVVEPEPQAEAEPEPVAEAPAATDPEPEQEKGKEMNREELLIERLRPYQAGAADRIRSRRA
jgi:cell division septum initiation protein DivIVA